jgi:uncharacterized protein (DUF342 family)
MSFVSKITAFVHSVKVHVSDAFVKLFGKDQSEAFAAAALSLLHSAAGVVISDAVKAAEELINATGEEKRAAALKQILSDSRIQALGVSKSVLNLVLELAVQTLAKSAFGFAQD